LTEGINTRRFARSGEKITSDLEKVSGDGGKMKNIVDKHRL
jgi:hypothetical protein